MNQVQTYLESNQQTCCQNNHEDQPVVGYCMLYECQDHPAICVRCVTRDYTKYHQGHQDDKYLKGFNDILEILYEGIKKLQEEEDGLKELHQFVNECQSYIEKLLLHKSENLIKKLQIVMRKIESIIEILIQRKQLFTQSIESLQQNNQHFFRTNIKQLQKSLLYQQNYKINEMLNSIKYKQLKLFQDLKNANLGGLNKKLIYMYFLQSFKGFSSFLRIDVQVETKLHFDQILIKNQKVTLAQIWKALKEFEKLYNASILYQKHNMTHQNDSINQEQILINQNCNIILQGQDQNVINFLDEVIQFNPNNEFFSCVQSKLLEVKCNYQSSIECMDEDIQLNPQNANLYNKKGIFLHQFGKFEYSTEQFDQAIKLSPNNPIYYINKGISLIQLGDYDDSIIYFNQAIILEAINPSQSQALNLQVINQYTQRINSQIRNDNTIYQFPLKLDKQNLLKQDDAENYLKQGNDLQNQGDYLNAILCYDVTISLKPDYAKTYNDKGYSLHQLQKYEKAIQCYEKAIKLKEHNAQYYNNNGNSLKRLSKYQDAVQCYNEAIRLEPDCADFYNNKGLCLQELEQYDEAIRCYDQAIRLNPELGDYYNNKGKSLEKLQQYQDSIKCYDQAKKLTQSNSKEIKCCNETNEQNLKDANFSTIIVILTAETLQELSKHQKNNIQHEEGIKLTTDSQPSGADYYYNKGLALHQLQKYQDAIICYDEAIRQNPNNANYYNNKGMTLTNLQRDIEAIKCFDQAIKLNEEMKLQHNNKRNIEQQEDKKIQDLVYLKQDANLYNKLGHILHSQQKYQYAIKYYEMAIRLQPDNAEAFYYKGCSLFELQQYQYAISCFDDAIRFKPNDADFYYNKGLALQELKQYQSAINCLNESIRLKPADVNYQNKKGNILQQLQQNENATNCYDQAIRLNPNNISFQNNKSNILHQQLQQNQDAIKCSNEVIRLSDKNHNLQGISICKELLGLTLEPCNDDSQFNKILTLQSQEILKRDIQNKYLQEELFQHKQQLQQLEYQQSIIKSYSNDSIYYGYRKHSTMEKRKEKLKEKQKKQHNEKQRIKSKIDQL